MDITPRKRAKIVIYFVVVFSWSLEAMLHYVTTPQNLKEKLLKVWVSV